MTAVSIIVPVLDEAASIGALLDALLDAVGAASGGAEIIVVDGGSSDATAALARAHPAHPTVIDAPRGRARQMNAGAAAARGNVLLFVHADSRIPDAALPLIEHAVAHGIDIGCFGLRIASRDLRLRAGSMLITARSRVIPSGTGDQCLFVTREWFDRLGGYPEWPLFEDMELVRRARDAGARWYCLPARVTTSARRWERQGVNATIVRMWALRLMFHAGVSPSVLAGLYGHDVRNSASSAK